MHYSRGALRHQALSQEVRRLSWDDYRDRMTAAWIGQMAGVGWGAPTEFKCKGEIIPADKMPAWKPAMVNQFQQDDIYVEMTFLRTLEQYGLDVSIRQAGIDFANSGYPLWHANKAGRDNLRAGIAPPDSGHPEVQQARRRHRLPDRGRLLGPDRPGHAATSRSRWARSSAG